MPSTPAPSRRAPGRPLKSPLAIAGGYTSPTAAPALDAGTLSLAGATLTEREATIAEFEDYLRTVNNRDGRPYEERSIEAYLAPPRNLDKWLTANGIKGDFTIADTALLNRYFREYYLERGQGGTHTLSAT